MGKRLGASRGRSNAPEETHGCFKNPRGNLTRPRHRSTDCRGDMRAPQFRRAVCTRTNSTHDPLVDMPWRDAPSGRPDAPQTLCHPRKADLEGRLSSQAHSAERVDVTRRSATRKPGARPAAQRSKMLRAFKEPQRPRPSTLPLGTCFDAPGDTRGAASKAPLRGAPSNVMPSGKLGRPMRNGAALTPHVGRPLEHEQCGALARRADRETLRLRRHSAAVARALPREMM